MSKDPKPNDPPPDDDGKNGTPVKPPFPTKPIVPPNGPRK